MKYSKMFGKTVFGQVAGSEMASHQLLVKGGFIRESVAGRYFYLPLGIRVKNKLINLIREEMNKAGAQEMITPTLHPLELWKETNRDQSVGFELMTIKDRRESEFALGGTAEEMFVDVARKFQISYRDLPFNLYQFSQKFRDELRSRGGLLRVREFTMKDAYSFHATKEDFKSEYQNMWDTYLAIFDRIGLNPQVVEADNGYIGGDYSHEFIQECSVGESRYLKTKDGSYIAHEDVAKILKEEKNTDEAEGELKKVEAKRGTTMKDGVELHGLPAWQQIKNVLFVDEQGRFILAVIRGDLDVNEVKLKHAVKSAELRHATKEEVRQLGSEPGFISPVGLEAENLVVVADDSLKGVRNMFSGANELHQDYVNINYGRDFTADIETDIALAKEGLKDPQNRELEESLGVEVGNIFQLGYHYSEKMEKAVFVNEEGEEKPFYMGCYGIGIGRTIATVVEMHHDDDGILWPVEIAPYTAHLVSLSGAEEMANSVYDALNQSGIDVLWDDRDESPGVKFSDADLIGCPVRLVVSKRNGQKIEYKRRVNDEAELLELEEVLEKLKSLN